MTTSVLKDTFYKIPGKKQDHIINCALKEFAKRGYSGTNILDIAKRAKISVGSLYTYVDSKDELYLAVADILVTQQVEQIRAIELKDYFMDNICLLFQWVTNQSKKQTDGTKFYFDMMTEMVTPRIKDVSMRLEMELHKLYLEVAERAITQGEIPADTDKSLFTFMLNSYLITYQLALTTTHNREKSKIYFGSGQPEELGQLMCDHFEHSFKRK